MESADADDEYLLGTPADAQGHVTAQCKHQQAGVEQRGVEPDQALVEIDAAGEIDLQLQDGRVFSGQNAGQYADDGELRSGNVDDDADFERNQRRGSPTELSHGRDNEVALGYREERLQVADNLDDVADHIRREQHAVDTT